MADAKFTYGMTGIANGTIDLDTNTIKCLLTKVAASTTVDTEFDKTTLSGFTTLGEISATNYVRKTLTVTVSADTTNHRGKITISNVTWSSLGGASNDTIGGILIYKHITDDTDSIPLWWHDYSTTQATNGGDIVLSPHANGLAYLA